MSPPRRVSPVRLFSAESLSCADFQSSGSTLRRRRSLSTSSLTVCDPFDCFPAPSLTTDHGVSTGCADINACEQTPEGLSKQMFDGEDFETWLECYKINTASYHFTSFAFLPLLAAAKSVGGYPEPGNIVNLSSMSGITKTSQRGQFNYNAGKAATISLSHQLATEFARRNLGIRVNVVCPGYFPSVSPPLSQSSVIFVY